MARKIKTTKSPEERRAEAEGLPATIAEQVEELRSSEAVPSQTQPEDAPEPEVIVRQHPGWWPALVEAVCQTCGWVGPTRDQNEQRGRLLIRCDQREHRCGYED